jgi:hypothetical protein
VGGRGLSAPPALRVVQVKQAMLVMLVGLAVLAVLAVLWAALSWNAPGGRNGRILSPVGGSGQLCNSEAPDESECGTPSSVP